MPQRGTLLSLARSSGPQVPLPSGAAGDMGDPTTLANKLANPSVTDPAWLKALRRVENGVGTLADIAKGTITGGADEPGPSAENLGAILGALAPILGKIVYHGSPHVFDKFDMGKIGTGEGAQAYGHGLYFADAPSVAKTYADIPMQNMDAPVRVAKMTMQAGADPEKRLRTIFKGISDDDVKAAIGKANQVKAGPVYDVDLPDDAIAKMLDWDAPLSQQPEAVRAAVMSIDHPILNQMKQSGSIDYKTGSAINDVLAFIPDKPGSMVGVNRPENASAALRSAGIPGIRYYDGASRGKAGGELLGVERQGGQFVAKIRKYGVSGGQGNMPADIFTTSKPYGTEAEARKWAEDAIAGGTRNYVVFDDQLPKIVKVTR